MQATVVLLIALGGLGCQNPATDQPPALPDVRQAAGQPSNDLSSTSAVPALYPAYIGLPSPDPGAEDDESFGRCMRNTICSFFLGRDPDVRTAREIESAYYAGYYDR